MTTNKRHTTIEYWSEDDHWKATEANAERDLIGRGATPAAAIANYGELLDDALFSDVENGAQEVPADD